MSLHPFSNEQLNFFKFASFVLNEFPKAVRKIFVDMWDNRISPLPGYQPWDDSIIVRNMLLNKEGPKTKIPTNISFQDWDCTALFQATLYAKTFALPDSKGNMKTLGELYMKNRKPVPGPFHSPVASPSGDPNETIALAIDQLRLLRNTLCHSSIPSIDKVTFDQYVQCAKEAFTAVNLNTKPLDVIGNLAESDFPTIKVQGLNERILKERDDFNKFLESKVEDKLDGIKETVDESKKIMDEIKEKMDEIKETADESKKKMDGIKETADESKKKMDGIKEIVEITADESKNKMDEILKQVRQDIKDQTTSPETNVFNETVDVLLLTTDDAEFGEAHKILSNPKSEDAEENQEQLYFGEIGRNKVALLKSSSPTETGVPKVHALCAETIQKLKPKAIIGLGVCSGTKKNEHNRGDVLVSAQLDVSDGPTAPPGSSFDCSLTLTRLFDCGKFGWNGPCPQVLVPKVHIGQVISGPQDIDNKTHYPEAIGVDTQDEGLSSTIQNSQVPWVFCKSITNWVGGSENSRWHTFAAVVSASYVEHVLKKFYIPEQMEVFEKSLPKPFLPSMVPHFTGRQRECDEVVRHITSQSTRLVTISGSPGFGKTSVAIAVGHRLKRQGLPVYFLSLRNAKSIIDLTSKLFNSFAHTLSNTGRNQPSRTTDELCRVLSEIPSNVFIVLDNADNLFQSGEEETSQEVLDLLQNIFSRCKNVNFLCTTRMSLNFLNMKFQIHESINIIPLDNQSSSKLVQELLEEANQSECSRIAKICGGVPLAIQLLCGLIAEDDDEKPTQFLDDFRRSSESIVDLLDDPDLPSEQRLKILFASSFKRLSQQEQQAFVSLSVFVGETFDEQTAVKVIGGASAKAKRTLRGLKRKCLIASTTSEAKSLSFHALIRSFAVEKGQNEMKEIACEAKTRFLSHYISLFKDLNQQFLNGNSLAAFRNFEFEKQNIFHSLVEGISHETVQDEIFDVLSTADLFLDTIEYFNPA